MLSGGGGGLENLLVVEMGWTDCRGQEPVLTFGTGRKGTIEQLKYTLSQRYNTKCSGEKAILRGIFRVVSRFPLHFGLYLGNLG